MPTKRLKNQIVVCPPKTRRMAAKISSNLDKENMTEVSIAANKRRRVLIKKLQEKDTIKETKSGKEKKESCRSITVLETKPTVSHVTTRNMKESERKSKSDQSIRPKRNVYTQQKEISVTKPRTVTNITSLKENSFVQTRKMVALKCSSPIKKPHILTSSNVITRKKLAPNSGFEKKATIESADKGAVREQTKTRKERANEKNLTEPMYKNKLDDNMNTTVQSVFDFESNSQEVADTSDEPMKDVIEKLVRENKAVVKHKVTRKKEVTGVNEIVTKERIPHSELKQNYVKKLLLNLREVKKSRNKPSKAVLKTTATSSHEKIGQFVKPQSTDFVRSVNRTQMEEENVNMTENVDSEDWSEIVDSGDTVSIVDLEDVATSSWNEALTPPRPIRKTYKAHPRTSSKSITSQCQSTPVHQLNSVVSPWRVPDEELLTSSTINFEFSKIGPINETKDNMKESQGQSIKQNSAELQQTIDHRNKFVVLSNILIEPAKEKTISDDIKNYFGFNSDDNDENEDKPATQTNLISTIRGSFEDSLPNINLSIIETVKERHRAKKQLVDNCEISKKTTSKILKELVTPTAKQFGNFDNADYRQTTKKLINQVEKKKKKGSLEESDFRKLSILHEPNKITQKPCLSNSNSSYDVPILFETNWPTRENSKHRSYTRMSQHKYKSIVTDDDSEAEDSTLQRPHKKTKTKEDPKLEEKLKKFEEEFNANCREVDSYDLIVEVCK